MVKVVGFMPRWFCSILLLAFCLPSSAGAAGFQVTPLVGYTFGGEFEDQLTDTKLRLAESANFGLILGYKLDEATTYEVYFSRQRSQLKSNSGVFGSDPIFEVDINYLHFGGTYSYFAENFTPYVSGGLGVTHMQPERGDNETKFSFSVGGGVKLPVTESLALRLEGRGMGTLFDGSGALFCTSGSGCALAVSGNLMWQFTAFTGLEISF